MASLPPFHIGFVLFPDVTQLDFTGPAQVLTRMGNTTIELVAKSLDPVMTDAGFTLQPTATFDTARMPDILFVPGGFGVVPAMEDADDGRVGAQGRRASAMGNGGVHRRAVARRGGAAQRVSRDDTLGVAPQPRTVRRDPGP